MFRAFASLVLFGALVGCAFDRPPKSAPDRAVLVRVRVDGEGGAKSVDVLDGDEFGFGDVARSCALRAGYEPARTNDGRAIDGDLPLRIRFER
jgi:hypothetical protein